MIDAPLPLKAIDRAPRKMKFKAPLALNALDRAIQQMDANGPWCKAGKIAEYARMEEEAAMEPDYVTNSDRFAYSSLRDHFDWEDYQL